MINEEAECDNENPFQTLSYEELYDAVESSNETMVSIEKNILLALIKNQIQAINDKIQEVSDGSHDNINLRQV